MMTERQALLCKLAEECCEVAQRATKAMRFGMGEVQPGHAESNYERLLDEFLDLLTVAHRLGITRVIDEQYPDGPPQERFDRLDHFMDYSRRREMVEP